MKKTMLSLAVSAMLCGCASTGQSPQGKWPLDPLPVRADQVAGMQYAGEAFIAEGYVHSGVIVTPGRNWFFGQTDGFRSPYHPDRPTTMQEAYEQYGGVNHGAYAEMRGTGRSAGEQTALVSLYAMGQSQSDAARGGAGSSGGFKGGILDLNAILDYLRRVNLGDLTPIVQDRIVSKQIPMPLFDFGKSSLRREFHKPLQAFSAEVKAAAPTGLLHVHGFTDNIGTENANSRLAMERAKVVHDFLAKEGVQTEGLVVTGKPLCCYIQENASEDGRKKNRRVELRPGGIYATAGTDPTSVGKMIARVLKAVGGNPNAPVRVIGAADTHKTAEALRQELISLLEHEAVGLRNVSPGDAAYSASPRLVIEIME